MKFQILAFIVFFFFTGGTIEESHFVNEYQDDQSTTKLFREKSPLNIILKYSNKDLRKNTNDSTYLDTELLYQEPDGAWDSVNVRIRARGNWRRENCFLAPVKMRIKKSERKGTVFKGNKDLKLVLPCQNSDRGQDYVLKEYLAYKLYETITPYHFKVRRLHISYSDIRKKKEKEYEFIGFAIEDISEVAKRNDAKRRKNNVHYLGQDDIASIQNDFFQFMIGNTDYSSSHQHNEKIIYVKGKDAIPIPYDFDMSGFVDASYAIVSQVQGEVLEIDNVRDRLYRGYKRDEDKYQEVRLQYIENKELMLSIIEGLEEDFNSDSEYRRAYAYIKEFFEILESDKLYKRKILSRARK